MSFMMYDLSSIPHSVSCHLSALLEFRGHPGSWIVYTALHSPPDIAVAGSDRSDRGDQSDDLLD